MSYYQGIPIWTLDGKNLDVAENNDHLGLVVSGLDEEAKNVDKNIDSARQVLFALSGNIFSYKCKISQRVLYHIWSIFVSPVVRSGLAALPIRPSVMKTLTRFHLKILRGVLKFSKVSPLAPLFFLLGELPIEATIHLDILTLFWSIWANPQTKLHDIVKYLLMMSGTSSVTWSAHIRILFQLYQLPDPLTLLSATPWTKERWKLTIKTAVISHTEACWRRKAVANSKLVFLNVQTLGLSRKVHPVLHDILTTQDVTRSRIHVRMLAGDYPCFAYIGSELSDKCCKLCQVLHPQSLPPVEDMVHLVASCRATADTRTRVLPDLLNLVSQCYPYNQILAEPNQTQLTQFILDPTSLNLPVNIRISSSSKNLHKVIKVCRNICYSIHKDRTKQLKNLN